MWSNTKRREEESRIDWSRRNGISDDPPPISFALQTHKKERRGVGIEGGR